MECQGVLLFLIASRTSPRHHQAFCTGVRISVITEGRLNIQQKHNFHGHGAAFFNEQLEATINRFLLEWTTDPNNLPNSSDASLDGRKNNA
jgi:hypothetical protein